MPPSDRDGSHDKELVRLSHSFASVPMWDSADPERAPPPLPLNPGSPRLTTRPNTSAAIANAAKALEEKARESMPASAYTTNPMPQRSPDRSLIKGATHKRMQSLQTTSVRDLKSFLDERRANDRSPDRPGTRNGDNLDYLGPELNPSRRLSTSPTVLRDAPTLRPTARPLQKPLLGENTPPSATMLALQTMTVPKELLEPPYSRPAEPTTPKNQDKNQDPPSMDAISNQLLSITNIVSSLQKDMTQLSRRSKDNATDLVSLKEATNARDEDIRRSLKELVVTMNHPPPFVSTPGETSRSGSSIGFKDPHMTPTKQFSLPKMTSPTWMVDERVSSPNPYSVEGAASVAMLEKIIREMVTKDGQERLIANLQTLVDKATGETAKKVAELVEFVKHGSENKALGAAPSSSNYFQPSPGTGPLTRAGDVGTPFSIPETTRTFSSPKAADFVSEEMLTYLRKIKDSVAESGCVTMGTKALIQDLRGEVLGMGRDLARKLEQFEQHSSGDRALVPATEKQDLALVIQSELENLKEHLDQVIREQRRQSLSSTVTRNTVNEEEVYDVVKHALAERGLDQISAKNGPVDTDAIIAALREAYESYKPNIEIQQIGLGRDEVLECLREGLQDYRGSGSITKEDVEHLIQDSLQTMKLPTINEAAEIREDVLSAVRECLQDFMPAPVSQQQSIESVSREMIIDAIREGLANRDNMEIDIPQEALFEAVRVGLESSRAQPGGQDEILQHLHAMVDTMHKEFREYSTASGHDNDQILDALKDGLDTLRAQIETYVDKAQDVTQKDEIIENVRADLDRVRMDIQDSVAEAWPREELVSFIKTEFENLHEGLAAKVHSTTKDVAEIIQTINEGFESMRSQVAIREQDIDTNEEINEAMKEEFDQLKAVIIGNATDHKGDIIEKLQAGFETLHATLSTKASDETSNADLLHSLKEEFEHLRETIAGTLVRSGSADKEDIIDALRELIDGLKANLATSQEDVAKQNLSSFQAEVQQLRESISSALVRTETSGDKEEILDALKSGLDDLKTNAKSQGLDEELLEAFRGELEQLRQSDGLTRQHARADTEEVLEAVRLGLDDLQSHLEKKLDNPESRMAATTEIIDALNDGLEGLRKSVDKPVDMTVSYEILDTLKDGIANLRDEIASLKDIRVATKDEPKEQQTRDLPSDETAPATGTELILSDDPEHVAKRESLGESTREPFGETLRRNDLEKMEVMLGQLQVKMETIDANIHNQAPAPASEPAASPSAAITADLTGIEATLKELRETVVQLQERELNVTLDGMATKEDTDAIETLLGNVKAKIEELNLPEADKMVTRENIDDVELVVRTTAESVEELSRKIAEEGATKADVAVVQVIVDDIKLALDEMKAAKPEEEKPEEKVTKTDIDDLALIVCDIKAKVDEMKIPDPNEIPAKADVEQLLGLVLEFRESHDKLKDQYESDINVTAGAFDDRRKEAEGISEGITEVKVLLDEVKEDIKATLKEGGSLDGLKDSFKSLEENITLNVGITADVKELMETVSREFERAHGSIEGLQNSQEEKSAAALEKQNEAKEAIIASLVEKVDNRFDILMTKYDDAQLLADEQARVMKEKAEQQEKILESTKTMADELKTAIDALSASIASMNDRYEEASQKWATDYSAAVFGKIDDAVSKMEEQQTEDKAEHTQTRDNIAKVENIFTGLQEEISEYHPKFMVTLREIEALVKQHYDHSQKAKEVAEEQVRLMNEEARSRAEEVVKQLNSLPALLPPPPPAIELPEKYDDAPVQEKLDKLLSQAMEAEKSAAQLERLDEIQQQVKATAAEVSGFLAKQTQLVIEGNESKEREAEELALLVERRRGQKEQLEEDIAELRAEKARVIQELKEEKERAMAEFREEKARTVQQMQDEKNTILAAVAALQAERENLANQKVRLTGEVSSLHTALEIRREELHNMDVKADELERRILNGIMDHSRALMIAKGPPKSSSKKKRVSTDAATEDKKAMPPPSTAANGVSMALKPRPAIRRQGAPDPASRRIFSLSQISGNTPTGGQAHLASTKSIPKPANIKRSHSVKTNYLTKPAWTHPDTTAADKENILNPVDEADTTVTPGEDMSSAMVLAGACADDEHSIAEVDEGEYDDDSHSEAGTERRHSFASGSNAGSYAEGETPGFDARSSVRSGVSEYTYVSGSSYMTGSDIDERRTSFGSNATRSVVPEDARTIGEEVSEGEQSDADDDNMTTTIPAGKAPEVNASEVSDSAVTASEVTGSELSMLPTQSEIDAAVEAVKAEMKQNWSLPSDSGLGSDLATAKTEHEFDADYFRRAAEEDSVVGAAQ